MTPERTLGFGAMSSDSGWQWYVAVLAVAVFIGAGIWWRASGDPLRGGLIIVGAALVVLLVAAIWARRLARR